MIERRTQTIATFDLVPSPRGGALIVSGDLLNFFHLILLIKVLSNEFFVLNIAVIK